MQKIEIICEPQGYLEIFNFLDLAKSTLTNGLSFYIFSPLYKGVATKH